MRQPVEDEVHDRRADQHEQRQAHLALLDLDRVIDGWNELGLWTPDAIIRVPLADRVFDVEVYDRGWNLIADDAEILRAEEETLHLVAEECNRFLQGADS